jgi:hypothetical protein
MKSHRKRTLEFCASFSHTLSAVKSDTEFDQAGVFASSVGKNENGFAGFAGWEHFPCSESLSEWVRFLLNILLETGATFHSKRQVVESLAEFRT